MGKINVLDFEIANLIAAGEVVERPSSVMKELIENSIDSGATEIVAEIKRGGVALIRVSDNGCGMDKEDIPVALKRHATSKIKNKEDLEGIMTLGFRGEALAAISSVSMVTIITKTKDAPIASMLTSEGGRVTDVSEVGAADGTTVVVENLFYNVPARRKFLKKDSTEAQNVAALVEKVALSRPDISIQLLIDGEERFKTPGNGELLDAIYAVFGREFSSKLIKADGVANGITVTGYVGRSDNVRKNRNLQNVFINGRYVKSLTAMAAIEKAYTSYIAPEAFPVCVLFLEMNPGTVDVNVHPAKLEVKFANEQPVFEAVYYTVKRAIEDYEYRPEMQLGKQPKNDRNPLGAFVPIGQDTKGEQIKLSTTEIKHSPSYSAPAHTKEHVGNRIDFSKYGINVDKPVKVASGSVENIKRTSDEITPKQSMEILQTYSESAPQNSYPKKAIEPEALVPPKEVEARVDSSEYRIIGEAFDCYVMVEYEGALLVIDKHAAHERIIFEDLKRGRERDGRVASQSLLLPVTVILTADEYSAAEEYRSELESIGFEIELISGHVNITAIPDAISVQNAESLLMEMLDDIIKGKGNPELTEKLRREKALYQVACKAAIKGGRSYDSSIIDWLVGRILALPDIIVCPHGRPIAFRLTKTELDRQFDRIK
jgi:DNA mismatch repair protein MutL